MHRIIFASIAVTFVLSLNTGSALAQIVRTFVSGQGVDSGGCGRPAPCRTFAYALSQTASGGDIAVLDAAGYGSITITQPVNIVNDGGNGEAAVTVNGSGQSAVTINLGAGGGSVTLRGLTLVNKSGGFGIQFGGTGTLRVENCVISGFGVGIDFVPTGSAALYVTDTVASDNNQGFQINQQGGQSAVFFERAQALNNQNGFTFEGVGPILATIADSAAVGNAADGFSLQQGTVTITRSTASGNTTGVRDQGGEVFLSGTTLTNNSGADFRALGTGIISYGNNTLTGPAGNNSGSLTPASLQ